MFVPHLGFINRINVGHRRSSDLAIADLFQFHDRMRLFALSSFKRFALHLCTRLTHCTCRAPGSPAARSPLTNGGSAVVPINLANQLRQRSASFLLHPFATRNATHMDSVGF